MTILSTILSLLLNLAANWWRVGTANVKPRPPFNPFKEDSAMLGTTIQEFLDQKAAEDEARGEARGLVEILLLDVTEGVRSPASAIARINSLVEAGRILPNQADEAIGRLS